MQATFRFDAQTVYVTVWIVLLGLSVIAHG